MKGFSIVKMIPKKKQKQQKRYQPPPSDVIMEEDFANATPIVLDLKAVREMFPGYKVFTQVEAHELLRIRPDKHEDQEKAMKIWNDYIDQQRREEVANYSR